MRLAHTFAEVRAATAECRSALVPTLGALHDGHLSLVARAADNAECVVMSVFVNPLQFDDPRDLERYPRDLDRDSVLAAGGGVDILFAPSVEEMYPLEPRVRVHVGGLTTHMEGAHRPGHFEGVATVVAKLFAGCRPDIAVFGKKDAQQLAVVRRMALDLSFPVEILGEPTVRDEDGLALSSRNMLLSDHDRAPALSLSSGLRAAAAAAAAGERAASVLEGLVADSLLAAGVEPEYVTLADALEAAPVERLDRECFLAVAARVGSVRLIDNVFLTPDGASDTGTVLRTASTDGRS